MDSIDDLRLWVKCPRVEADRGDHNPLELPLQPEKRASSVGGTDSKSHIPRRRLERSRWRGRRFAC